MDLSTATFGTDKMTPVPVVTRSFDDKPTVTTATKAEANCVLIGTQENPAILQFPADHVFRYDAKLVALLERAFNSGDSKQLAALWGKAVPLF